MDDVAREAGVGVGTVYRHFPHKEALMGELVASKFRAFADNAERRARRSRTPGRRSRACCAPNAETCVRDMGIQQALGREPGAWAARDARARAPERGSRTS